jgi:hypothetical protein
LRRREHRRRRSTLASLALALVTTNGSCSALSLALDEPLAGTASETRAWLLVEQPGPWGRFAFRESRLDPELGATLEERCAQAGVNPFLIKRPGRATSRLTRRVLLVSSQRGNTWIRALDISDQHDLLGLDLEALGRGEQIAGEPVAGPVYLVCTNGKRDACCATMGRPIAQTLAERRPESVWECSHTGGHRFAGVLICLPAGVVYGRLDPQSAVRAVESYERGTLELDWLRGRSSYGGSAQAADVYLRLSEHIAGLDDVSVVEQINGRVVLERTGGARYAVTVTAEEAEPPRPNSCRDLGTEGKRPTVWRLDSLERLSSATTSPNRRVR